MHRSKDYGSTPSDLIKEGGPLSASRRLGYGVGHVLNDLCAACWFSYLLVYLSKVALLSDTQTGLLMLVGQVADGVATPFVGFLSDSTLTKYGRRTLWVGGGSIMLALTFPMVYHLPVLSGVDRTFYYAFFIVLCQFSWASVQVSHLALAPELTQNNQDRVILTTLRSAFTTLSNVAVYVVAYFLFRDDESQVVSPGDEGNFHFLMGSIVGTGLFFTAIFCVFVKERPSLPITQQPGGRWNDWLKSSNFLLVGGVYMSTRAYVNVTQTYLSLYLLNSLEAPKTSIAVIPGAVFLVSFASTLCCNWMSKYMDSAQMTLAGICFGLVGCLGFLVTPEGPGWGWSLIGSTAFGIGGGIVGVAALQMISDLFGPATPSSAFVYGAMSLADKVFKGSVMMLVQANTPHPDDSHFPNYHRYAVSLLPGFACLLGGVLIVVLKLQGFPGRLKVAGDRVSEARVGAKSPLLTPV